MNWRMVATLVVVSVTAGCAAVDVTKTAKGYHAPTNPNEVQILFTKPDGAFEEVAAVTVTGFEPNQTAKMHNALRQKAAPVGADAVLILSSGVEQNHLWATAVAIKLGSGGSSNGAYNSAPPSYGSNPAYGAVGSSRVGQR